MTTMTIAWQPLAFIGLLAVLIILYEAWAFKKDVRYTITVGMRSLTERTPWIAILILLLTGFFFCHCFGHSLKISQ